MGRPSNTDERRHQIVEALVAVMAEHGYERASIALVAKTAGLAPGLVHYHFKDKQEILLGLVEHLAGRLQGRLETRLERAGDEPRAQLEAFVDAYLALGDDSDPKAVASWVGLSAEAIRQPEVKRAYGAVVEKALAQLEKLVRAVLTKSRRSSSGARSVAAALFAAIQGYYVLSAAAPDATPPGSAAAAVKRMAEGLLQTAARDRS
jgi:TetR/AcrR family transcriptional regulator, transcriptional repressor of bet genes